MPIDEAINFVENMIYNYRPYGEQLEDWNKLLNLLRWYKDHDIKNKYEAQTDIIAQMEQELNWWREQSLVRREDVHNMIKDYCRVDDKDCKEKVGCDCCKFLSVQQIPEAEPPKEQSNE